MVILTEFVIDLLTIISHIVSIVIKDELESLESLLSLLYCTMSAIFPDKTLKKFDISFLLLLSKGSHNLKHIFKNVKLGANINW